jgi:hypothetical protein
MNKQQILIAIVAAFFAGIVSASSLDAPILSAIERAFHESQDQSQAY